MIVQPTITTMRGRNLGPQIHVGQRPTPDGFCAASNGESAPLMLKPKGGLWTSTCIDNTTGWAEWCRGEDFGGVDVLAWWQVTPDPDARVLVIDSVADLDAIAHAFPYPAEWGQFEYMPSQVIDFEAIIAAGYDGLRLTSDGLDATRYQPDLSTSAWDCESTVWLRWCFIDVTCVREATE